MHELKYRDTGKVGRMRLWLVMAPTALLMLFGILALVGLFAVGARLDAAAKEAADIQMKAALKHAGDTLSALAKDNAWWDDAFENVYVSYSEDWVQRTWGAGGFSSDDGDVDGLMVLDRAGKVIGGYGLDLDIDQKLSDSMRGLGDLIEDAVKGPADEPEAVIRWLRTQEGIVLAAAVPITPFEQRTVYWDPERRPVVVVFNRIDEVDFARFERQAGVSEMELVDSIPDDRTGQVLVGETRDKSTSLAWKVPTPGEEMVDKLLVPVAGLTILLFGLSLSAGRRILSHEQMLATSAEELRDAHRLLGTALDIVDEGFAVSVNGEARFWNAEFERLIGLADIKPGDAPSGIRERMMAAGFRIIDGDEDLFMAGREEGQWLMTDRQRRVLSIRRLAIPNGFMLLARDVTRDREAQQELIDARRDAEHANHIKSKFLAQMSHELRTPLNAVLGFSEVIALGLFGKVQPDAYAGYAENIQQAGRHLLNLVNDVLDLSKIEAGRMEANLESVTIAGLAEDARMLLGAKAEAKDITFTMSGDADLKINADPKMAKQVLLNLMSNAVKFTQKGGCVDVTWRRVEGGMIETVVNDTGIGMSESDLERAMTPFGQAKRKSIGDEPGTGLGLPIVAGLCKAQGGSFRIESKVDVGTSAIVRLPEEPVAA